MGKQFSQRVVSCLNCRVRISVNNLKMHQSSERCTTDPHIRYKQIYVARREGLTLEILDELLEEAGITMDNIGQRADSYHLARYGDAGDYSRGNCRFITARENIAERKHKGPKGQKKHPLSDEHRAKVAKKSKEFWDSEKGQERRRILSARMKNNNGSWK